MNLCILYLCISTNICVGVCEHTIEASFLRKSDFIFLYTTIKYIYNKKR